MKQTKWEREFSERFKKHEGELKWLYCELYNNDVNAWNYFAGMLRRMWEERPASLRALDVGRENNPEWYVGGNLRRTRRGSGAYRNLPFHRHRRAQRFAEICIAASQKNPRNKRGGLQRASDSRPFERRDNNLTRFVL